MQISQFLELLVTEFIVTFPLKEFLPVLSHDLRKSLLLSDNLLEHAQVFLRALLVQGLDQIEQVTLLLHLGHIVYRLVKDRYTARASGVSCSIGFRLLLLAWGSHREVAAEDLGDLAEDGFSVSDRFLTLS